MALCPMLRRTRRVTSARRAASCALLPNPPAVSRRPCPRTHPTGRRPGAAPDSGVRRNSADSGTGAACGRRRMCPMTSISDLPACKDAATLAGRPGHGAREALQRRVMGSIRNEGERCIGTIVASSPAFPWMPDPATGRNRRERMRCRRRSRAWPTWRGKTRRCVNGSRPWNRTGRCCAA